MKKEPIVLYVSEHAQDMSFRLPAVCGELRKEIEARLGKTVIIPKEAEFETGKLPVIKAIFEEDAGGFVAKINTFYFIGAIWLIEKLLAVVIEPKINDDNIRVDVTTMLSEALTCSANVDHLKNLLNIDFKSSALLLPSKDDGLRLFVIAEFVSVVSKLVKQGLRRGFNDITETLKYRLKGKLLMARTFAQQKNNCLLSHLVCRYQVHSLDTPENRLIKQALMVSARQLKQLSGKEKHIARLSQAIVGLLSAFAPVSDSECTSTDLRKHKIITNPFFLYYEQAIQLARRIIQFNAYVSKKGGSSKEHTPPYWIDMPKLFELYVHQKLCESLKIGVFYHIHCHWQELDFFCHTKTLVAKQLGTDFIADAKYKPRYASGGICKEDARQIAGYSRLSKIIDATGRTGNQRREMIPCLIIFPDQTSSNKLDWDKIEAFNGWEKIYKLGIKIPEESKIN